MKTVKIGAVYVSNEVTSNYQRPTFQEKRGEEKKVKELGNADCDPSEVCVYMQ